jgi:hypothetical protein
VSNQDLATVEHRRRHPRVPCRDARFSAAVQFEDSTIREFEVVARNISRGGIAIMHDKFIEPGTACVLALPVAGEEIMGVQGQVRFCRKMALVLHEIGLEFDEPLEQADLEAVTLVDGRNRAQA